MTSVTKHLNLPIIGGELSVDYFPSQQIIDLRTGKTESDLSYSPRDIGTDTSKIRFVSHHFNWSIRFVMHGPDARYNSATGGLYPKTIQPFIAALQESLNLMTAMEKEPVGDTFTKHIEYERSSASPRLYVKMYKSWSKLALGMSTGTYEFSREINRKELEQFISILSQVESDVKNMTDSLRNRLFSGGFPIRDGFETPWEKYVPYEFEYETVFIQPKFRHLFSKERAIQEAIKEMKAKGWWRIWEENTYKESNTIKFLQIKPKF